MGPIKNKTREQLLEILIQEYPNEEKGYLEKLSDNIISLSRIFVKNFFHRKS